MNPELEEIVLVVEDEEESRETLREVLEFEGHVVRTAVNGQEALELLATLGDRVCLILLDLAMPVMDGWELLERLRSDEHLAHIKVVITTSAAHRAPVGVTVFEKPLDLDAVLRTVEANC